MTYADNPHKVGPPFRASSAASKCVTMRFNEDELEAVARHVERTGFSRAELVREAIRRAGLFGEAWLEFAIKEPPGGIAENVVVRFTRPELEALDRHVRRLATKRAKVIRGAMDQMGLFSRARVDMFADAGDR